MIRLEAKIKLYTILKKYGEVKLVSICSGMEVSCHKQQESCRIEVTKKVKKSVEP